jgi:hypothetical protein
MPVLSKHTSKDATKILLCGISGSGKTTSIAKLINDPKYRVIIHDFDNGLDGLLDECTPEGLERTVYKSYRDDPKAKRPTAWREFEDNIFDGWTEEDGTKIPAVKDLPPETVLVVDTWSFATDSAMNMARFEAGAWGKPTPTSQPTWGQAIDKSENMLSYLTGPAVNCSVIIMSHLQPSVDEVTGKESWYPVDVTKRSSTKIGAFFNHVFRVEKTLTKDGGKFTIRTRPDHKMGNKTSSKRLDDVEEADLAMIMEKIQNG